MGNWLVDSFVVEDKVLTFPHHEPYTQRTSTSHISMVLRYLNLRPGMHGYTVM